jgi:AcrR family transcriptional regulator
MLAERPNPEAPAKLGIRERNKLERRARIVSAARSVFNEKGFAAATTREIAERANVGTGTVFLYARDKRELLIMIINDELDAMNERAVATAPRRAPLVTQLMHYFAPQLRFWADDIALARLATAETHAALTRPRDGRAETERLHDRRIKTFAALTSFVEQAQARNAFSPDCDPELVAHLIFDIHIGENRKWLSGEHPTYEDAMERLRIVLTFALKGFGGTRVSN